MSSTGTPHLTTNGTGLHLTLIAARWHENIMNGLLNGARTALQSSGATWTEIRVPGSFELPVAAARAATTEVDALVALGVVIRGGTPHFEYVCTATTTGLTNISTHTGIPIGFGVLTCDNEAQALDRAGLIGSSEDKGAEAVEAALATAVVLKDFGFPVIRH